MESQRKIEVSYCRTCGGDRDHVVFAEMTRDWSEKDAPVDGSDRWAIVECAGCHTVTFVHSHWFSEEYEMTENGPEVVLYRDLYPPAPPRKMPEWGIDLYLCLNIDDLWVVYLHKDIYAALGLKAYALAAMGARAIVDFVVTSKAGYGKDFKTKLNRMQELGLITETQVDVVYAAFDAGSAAAHRGYSPSQEDVFTLLGITESLLHQVYIAPVQRDRQAKDAAALKMRTPQRACPKAYG